MEEEFPNVLRDNILYYIAGYIIKKLLPDLQCPNWKAELLLNFQDPKGLNMSSYLLFVRLTCFKQNSGLIYLSPTVLRIVKATGILFQRRAIEQGIGINTDKNLNLKLESSVFQQFSTQILLSGEHFFKHRIEVQSDHLSSLLGITAEKYVGM